MDKLYKPKVSIIIPVYNGANYLAQAINSALAQTYDNIEIIVVNDGSNDDGATERIALSYGGKIRYYSKSNGGVSSALNFGIKKMQGDYFSWLSHDDLYAPQKIEKTLELVDKGPEEKTIAFCGTRLINKDGQTILSVKRHFNSFYTGFEMFRECFRKKKGINGCTLLIPKRAFDEVGYFSNLIYIQDMECWAKFMMIGYYFVHTSEELVMMRIHSQQVTNLRPQKYYEEYPIYLNRLYQFAKIRSSNSSAFLKELLISCIQSKIQIPSLERKIEKDISISFLTKVYYRYKGSFLVILKRIYQKHIIKHHISKC